MTGLCLPPLLCPVKCSGLQGVYRAFVRNAKFMTQSSAPDVAFVGSCVVEMYGLDLVRAYEHAFTYIKQLASLLRGAMSSHSKDAYRQVYCWQTVNTLELWSKLLAAHHDKEVNHPPWSPRASSHHKKRRAGMRVEHPCNLAPTLGNFLHVHQSCYARCYRTTPVDPGGGHQRPFWGS